jgi:hypothetical protein
VINESLKWSFKITERASPQTTTSGHGDNIVGSYVVREGKFFQQFSNPTFNDTVPGNISNSHDNIKKFRATN